MCCDEKTRGPRNFLSTTELLEQNQELEELYPNIDDIKDATAKTYISLMKQQLDIILRYSQMVYMGLQQTRSTIPSEAKRNMKSSINHPRSIEKMKKKAA